MKLIKKEKNPYKQALLPDKAIDQSTIYCFINNVCNGSFLCIKICG